MMYVLWLQVYLAVSNRCPVGVDGKSRSSSTGTWAPGITLYTSMDGATSFSQTCLPVAIKVGGRCAACWWTCMLGMVWMQHICVLLWMQMCSMLACICMTVI